MANVFEPRVLKITNSPLTTEKFDKRGENGTIEKIAVNSSFEKLRILIWLFVQNFIENPAIKNNAILSQLTIDKEASKFVTASVSNHAKEVCNKVPKLKLIANVPIKNDGNKQYLNIDTNSFFNYALQIVLKQIGDKKNISVEESNQIIKSALLKTISEIVFDLRHYALDKENNINF